MKSIHNEIKKKSKNIFLCHTPYQLFLSSIIAEKEFHDKENIAIIEGEFKTDRKSYFSKTISLQKIGGSVKGSRKKIERMHALIKELTQEGESRLFISDISWPSCNRIFFSRELSKHKIFFISDGIGSYLDIKKRRSQVIKDYIKELGGALGITSKYKNFLSHHMGYDHIRSSGLFIPNPQIIKNRKIKKYDVKLPTITSSTLQPKSILFLDQPFWIIIGEEWEELFRETIEYLKSQTPEHTIFFKMHHRSREKERNALIEEGFTELDPRFCIEELSSKTAYSKVISFKSSALLHLKWISPPTTEIISLEIPKIKEKSTSINDLDKLFKEFGITQLTSGELFHAPHSSR